MAELLRWGNMERAFELVKAALDDPKSLEPFAKRLRERARTFIDAGGEGAWPPPAESTLAKWNAEGTSDITRHGKIRKSKVDRIEQQIARLQKRTAKSGFGEGDRRKLAALQRRATQLRQQRARPAAELAKASGRVEALRGQIDALTSSLRELHRQPNKRGRAEQIQRKQAQLDRLNRRAREADIGQRWAEIGTTYKGRDIGQRTGATRKLMPRMPGTIRAKVRRIDDRVLEVRVYSRAAEVGYYHHTGTAKGAPKRVIIPDPNAEDLDVAVKCLEGAFIKAWSGEE